MPGPGSRQIKSDSGGGAQVQYFTQPSGGSSRAVQGMKYSLVE